MAGVLKGVRVVDMGRYIAGPLCGALLADLGAEVIRVERIGGGEDRTQFPTSDDTGANFLAFNRNKLGMTLNPAKPEGREVLRRLLARADMLVVNLPMESLVALGLDHDSLKAIKPDIILVHTSAFGNDGPYAERVGFDGIGQVMCGATYLSGFPEQPMKFGAPWVDCMTALFNAFGALAALLHKRQTGQGLSVETNLLRSAMTVANGLLIEQALLDANRIATGNRLQAGGPGDLVRTKDGWILVQVVSDTLYRRWARLMGEEMWLTDPRFATDGLRAENGEVLSERTRCWAAERTTAQALAELAAAKVPPAPCSRRRRCSTIRTCAPPACCARSPILESSGRSRWSNPARASAASRPPCAAPPGSASTRTRSCAISATTTRR